MGDRFEPADGAGPLDAPTNVIDVAAKAEDGSNHQQIHASPRAEEEDPSKGRRRLSKSPRKRSPSRSRSRSKSRSPSQSRDRRRRSRSRSRDRRRQRSRSRSRDRDSRERRRRRSRSRSRSRDRRRRSPNRNRRRQRSRDRGYDRRGGGRYADDDYGYRPRGRRAISAERNRMATIEDPFAKLRATAAVAGTDPAAVARQMQEQQLRARQAVLQQQAASAVAAASKTQREVYVGNLTPGVVNDPMLRQLFNATLQAAFPDRCGGGTIDPVIHINMAPEGRYCFIELLSLEMATACLQLSGQVLLAGSMLSIGRPAGYIDPLKAQTAAQGAAEALARFQAESQAARKEAGIEVSENDEESPFLCVDGMITANVLENDTEYNEVLSDIKEEFEKYGIVLRVAVPRPIDPSQSSVLFGTEGYGKVYVQYLEVDGAKAARAAVSGRLFSGQALTVEHMQAVAFMTAVGQIA